VWVVEGSDDAVSWTEIDRREHKWVFDRGTKFDVKAFAVSRSGSFARIPLRKTDPNYGLYGRLVISAFELFGAVAGLQ
jgi:hypothetical protein